MRLQKTLKKVSLVSFAEEIRTEKEHSETTFSCSVCSVFSLQAGHSRRDGFASHSSHRPTLRTTDPTHNPQNRVSRNRWKILTLLDVNGHLTHVARREARGVAQPQWASLREAQQNFPKNDLVLPTARLYRVLRTHFSRKSGF
jgi:hypothetical protein